MTGRLASPGESEQLVPVGEGRGSRAGVNVDLREDVAHMPIDRLLAQEQLFRDRAIGLPAREQAQHVELSWREPEGLTRRLGVPRHLETGELGAAR